MTNLDLFVSRLAYINWIVLCWICAAGLVISLLSYGNLLAFLAFAWLSWLLPYLYEIGLKVADFQNAQNMFEGDEEDSDI